MKALLFASGYLHDFSCSLFAHANDQFQSAKMAQSDLLDIVGGLSQIGLFSLLMAIALLGATWVLFLKKACAELKRPQNPMLLVVLVAGMSLFGSGCSTTQLAMVAQKSRTTAPAENMPCDRPHQHQSIPNDRMHSSGSYSNWFAPSFCRFCGQRMTRTGF